MEIFVTGELELLNELTSGEVSFVEDFDPPQPLEAAAAPMNCPTGIPTDPWTVGAVALLVVNAAPSALKFATDFVKFIRLFKKNKPSQDKAIVVNITLASGEVLAVTEDTPPEDLAAALT